MAGEEPRRRGDGDWRWRRRDGNGVTPWQHRGRVKVGLRWGIDGRRSRTRCDVLKSTRSLPKRKIEIGVGVVGLGEEGCRAKQRVPRVGEASFA